MDNIEFDTIQTKGKIYSNQGAKSAIIVNNSDFELNNSHFKLSPLKGTFRGKPYYLSLNGSKIFSNNPIINGQGKFNAFNLDIINDPNLQKLMPANLAKQLKDIE